MKIRRIVLLNYGVLNSDEEKQQSKANSLTGYFLYPTTITFTEKTDILKGQVGLKFGIEYFIEGMDTTAKYEDVVFYCKIIHPILTNPVTNEAANQTTERKINYLNQSNYDYYCFEYDWEVVAGKWVFQIIEDDKILLEKDFHIQ